MSFEIDFRLKWFHGISKPTKTAIIAGNNLLASITDCLMLSCLAIWLTLSIVTIHVSIESTECCPLPRKKKKKGKKKKLAHLAFLCFLCCMLHLLAHPLVLHSSQPWISNKREFACSLLKTCFWCFQQYLLVTINAMICLLYLYVVLLQCTNGIMCDVCLCKFLHCGILSCPLV